MQLTLTSTEFGKFRRFIYDAFGISLPEAKREMLSNRLRTHLMEQGFSTFEEYYQQRLQDPSKETLDELINRVSTNHTYFYRESGHFEHLCKVALPAVVPVAEKRSVGRPELRVWCAAASTGQEPYGIAIQLREYLGRDSNRWSAGLLATDISERALGLARRGIYSQEDVDPIPSALRQRYFDRKPDGWHVTAELKADVTYRRLNLMNRQFPFRKPFDAIFCRNVMIYFDQETRRQLVERMYGSLYPGGFFYVGLAESLGQNAGQFKAVAPGVYQRLS